MTSQDGSFHTRMQPTRSVPAKLCTDGGEPSLSTNDAFSLLANPTRRYVLEHLRREGAAVKRSVLARHVAARKHDCDPDEVPTDALERAITDLHHFALPPLRANGLVEYSEGVVVLIDEDPTIARLLDAADADTRS
ncbi:DUF7344 domain-containing protein [Natrinema halophilum]|uniref:DUF7344 domain-containing protein n=1 Tax=Natrinema halophilum TaxID=1699371 RepID=A0A7D5KDF0_9EURY|nr:hypothetical protein [Natrinema halophilum]QLG49341.1 hypothetical protein HYG82_10940 [Natrinema halophilum]